MSQKPRPRDEPIVNSFTFVRYMVVGTYVGLATVASMLWWFIYSPTGPHIPYNKLFEWPRCDANTFSDLPTSTPLTCDIFHDRTPNTIALSVLVTIEMFQALNSLSDRQSLLSKYIYKFSII